MEKANEGKTSPCRKTITHQFYIYIKGVLTYVNNAKYSVVSPASQHEPFQENYCELYIEIHNSEAASYFVFPS
jgi:hypothetical protein